MREIVSPLDGFLSPLGRLRSSAADFYAVAGFSPPLVFDFDDEYYRTGGSTTTFDAAITHTRASQATMVDSDGVLKWAPHNLLTYSEQFDNAAWAKANVTVTANAAISPDGNLTADKLVAENGATLTGGITPTCNVSDSYSNPPAEATNIASVFAKAGEFDSLSLVLVGGSPDLSAKIDVNLETGTLSGASGSFTPTIESVGSGWYKITIGDLSNSTSASPSLRIGVFDSAVSAGDGTSGIYIWGAHVYRSDLGGMVDNPERGDSYVPTTGSAVYMPRLGHHVWNGSAWVNEGLLHESEARTNLLLNSGTLATQSVTVSAVPYTLHFTGTGTITLSGASTAGPLVGTGAGENNRVFLTLTPTAGTLTLTVSGTVTNAQLEIGSTGSSYIPTSGSTVTRAADVLTIPEANLPWPEPVVIGPELVTNGTFDTDISGWTDSSVAGGSIAWNAAGYLDLTNTSGAARADTSMTVEIGKVYEVIIERVDAGSGGFAYLGGALGSSAYVSGVGLTQGVNKIYVVPTATTTLWLRISLFSAITASFDNISVREINPLAVSIQMDGAINYADEGVAAQQTFLRWQLDANNYVSVDLDTDGAATGEVNFNQAASGVVDTVATAGTALAPSIATAFNIASRHGSTFINGALNGTALTADTTPVALADLSATDFNLGHDYNGTIKTLRIWAQDVGGAGIEEAST